ncbi:uncharacterized protein LOC123539328 [Mercenaria mercenaria]|uniref:uncharacterized protein LOC123539328 n=1 Tax=Mercenaria mercenaria TaxID=6596 RepID=UPI00234FA0EC|nr:uncharacterized protein LOC123539328 [Mercenaria mercenaria]
MARKENGRAEYNKPDDGYLSPTNLPSYSKLHTENRWDEYNKPNDATSDGYLSAKNLPSYSELYTENRGPEQYLDETCLWAYDNFAKYFVHKNVLPSNRELHTACRHLGRRSATFSNICRMICKQVVGTAEDIADVWASYRMEDCHLDGTISIVFVVMTTTDTPRNIHLKDYKYHLVSQNTFSNESEIVRARELSDETHAISTKHNTLEELRKCIAHHADDLLERHSNINVIVPSLKKSKGYYSDNHSIIDEPCIALYVPLKGCIPIHEDPFPQELDGYKVDVLEGKFETYEGGPNEFHEHLKMGLAIHAKILDSNKHLLGGTLGGFVNHPVYKMCGITCAHVLCSSEEMNFIKYCGIKDGLDKPVFQPVNDESAPFGRVVMAVYKSGDESSSGMEAALFRIEERHPEDGSFPIAFNDIQAGFDENRPLTYNSGVVCEASSISPRTEVFKYGMTTGITRGSFALQGAVVRKERNEGNRHSFGYSLKDQLVVLQIGMEPFAEPGHSGALVLIEGDHHDSVAIGIVEGGIKGRVFVTPICDILRAFGCSDLEMYKFNNSNNGSLSTDSGVDVDDSEAMDVNN